MGKSKSVPQPKPAPTTPAYQGTAIYQGDKKIGETYLDKKTNQLITRYYDDPEDKARQDQLYQMEQEYFNQSKDLNAKLLELYGQQIQSPEERARYQDMMKMATDYATQLQTEAPKANVLTDSWKQAMDKQEQDLTAKYTKQIGDIYDPMLKKSISAVAGRTGTKNTSILSDMANDQEKQRTQALTDVSRDIRLNRSQMENEQLARQQSYLDNLRGNLASTLGIGQLSGDTSYKSALNLSNLASQMQGMSGNPLSYLSGSLNTNTTNYLNQIQQQLAQSQLINNFNQGNYNTLANYQSSTYAPYVNAWANVNRPNSIWGSVIGGMGNLGGSLFSDKRLKENIEPIEDALNKVKAITGCTYNFRSFQERDGGVIAQDVQEALPEAIDSSTGILKVKYTALIGLLVQAVKELSDKVDRLEKGEAQ